VHTAIPNFVIDAGSRVSYRVESVITRPMIDGYAPGGVVAASEN
jgi:hypothetical protein